MDLFNHETFLLIADVHYTLIYLINIQICLLLAWRACLRIFAAINQH
jgi:hypothetical protein